MRMYTGQHRYYCGIDLHARMMYVCVLDQAGTVLVHRNLPTTREAFERLITPFRQEVVVAVECIFSWYWIADLCTELGVAFVLGHALYMEAIHGRARNDKIDSQKIAAMLRGGMLPMAHAYPQQHRSTRDLLRGCTSCTRKASSWLTSRTPTFSTTSPACRSGSPLPPAAPTSPSTSRSPWSA